MIFTASQAFKKIQNGDLKSIAQWPLSEDLMRPFLKQQRPIVFKEALLTALFLPGLFIIVSIFNSFSDSDWSNFWTVLLWSLVLFVCFLPIFYFLGWLPYRGSQSATAVYFGENLIYFGKTFIQWKGSASFKGCQIMTDRDPKVFSVKAKALGRGPTENDYMIPIPENHIETAKELKQKYEQ